MELESVRLRLRHWRPEDRRPFAGINTEPAVQRYLAPMTPEGSNAMLARIEAHFAEHGWGYWALEEKAGGVLVGMCGIMHVSFQAFFTPAVEIGWRLSERWQGKGLAQEAAQAVLNFAFGSLGLDRAVSFTVVTNTASWRLMERLGMEKVGEFDNPDMPPGHSLRRNVLYEIRAADFTPDAATSLQGRGTRRSRSRR